MTIWINEQFDSAGILRACIAGANEERARDCHKSFEADLTPEQRAQGWRVELRSVESWDEVPVSALKLS